MPTEVDQNALKEYQEYRRVVGNKWDLYFKQEELNRGTGDTLWKAGMAGLMGIASKNRHTAAVIKPLATILNFVHDALVSAGIKGNVNKRYGEAQDALKQHLFEHPERMKDHEKEFPNIQAEYEAYLRSRPAPAAQTQQEPLANSEPIGPQGALRKEWDAGKKGMGIGPQLAAAVNPAPTPSLEVV